MICKEEVCMWFKDNEPHRRLELICGLLNMCVPLELKFVRTCVEDLTKRDDVLRETNSTKVNDSDDLTSQLNKLDERTRRKLLIVYIALLEADNQTCSKVLFKTLSQIIAMPDKLLTNSDINIEYVKEMLLLYTMVIYHPAFSFEEKRVVGDDLHSMQELEKNVCPSDDSWYKTYEEFSQSKHQQYANISANSCHSDPLISLNHSQIIEQNCDSGLSIGTEPEGEILSDHAYFPDKQIVDVARGIPSNQDSSTPDLNMDSHIIDAGSNYFRNQNVHLPFYHFMDKLPMPTAPRRGPPPTLSETSSSEDNGTPGQCNPSRQRGNVRVDSPSSSPQSSPYASPPQSLSPSRAVSPKYNGTVATMAPSLSSSSHPHDFVTGTTTVLATSQSNIKTTIQQNSSNSGSHSSSPTINNTLAYRSKPLLNKNQKNSIERGLPRQRGLSNSASQSKAINVKQPSKDADIAPPPSSESYKHSRNMSSGTDYETSLDKENANLTSASQLASPKVSESAPLAEISSNSSTQMKNTNGLKSNHSSKSDSNMLFNESKDSIETTSSAGQVKNGVVSTATIPLYTTTISTTTVVPAMASPGNYQPYFSYPVMSLSTASPYYHSGSPYPPLLNPGRPHHQSLFFSNQSLLQGGVPSPLIKGPHSFRNPHYMRGGTNGRSGSSSSSSNCSLSSGHGLGGRKKNACKGGGNLNQKSRSSDSSPSSSQYSSPPQTPSPDHMKDVRPKNGKLENETSEDSWTDPTDMNGSNLVLLEDGHSLVGSHLPTNMRQRCMPYSPLGFMGYPQTPHLMRYPFIVSPRMPFSSGDKSSREATPPNSIQNPVCHPLPPSLSHSDSLRKEVPPPPLSMPPPASISTPCSNMQPASSHSKGKSSPPISSSVIDTSVPLLPPTHLPPPVLPPHPLPVSASANSNVQYNSSYPMFAVTGTGGVSSHFLTHMPSFMHPSPNPTSLPNSFVSPPHHPPLTPSFPGGNLATGPSNNSSGVASEFLYTPSQFAMLGPSSSQPPGVSSGSSHQPVISLPNGPPPPPPPPGLQISPTGIPFSPPYPSSQGGHPPPAQLAPSVPPPKKPFSCYNCGHMGHKGSDCKEASINDLTKHSVS